VIVFHRHAQAPAPDLIGDDPGIHQSSKNALFSMDCRVKPGNGQ